MKIHSVKMPEIGETVEKGNVNEWLVDIGDEVEKGEEILLVESDKAITEVCADVDGKLNSKLVKEGDEVRPGDPVAEIEIV